jgi:tetratricopeptide (TPR) repeat protein
VTDPQPPHLPDVQRLIQSGRPHEALEIARRSVAGAVACQPGHAFLASVLFKLGQTREAAEVVRLAETLPRGSPDSYDGLAYIATALGQHERANALYRLATEAAPRDPRFWYNLACSERILGRLTEAESACDEAIKLDEAHFRSYLLRSELQVQSSASNHVEELERALTHFLPNYSATVLLGYALAKEYDDLGHFDEAFRWFSLAAQTRRSRLNYDVSIDEWKIKRIAELYTCENVAPSHEDTVGEISVDSSRYIFVVGLPRSGTTLLERILTGLQGTRSNGETDNFSRALIGAGRGTGVGDVFEKAIAADHRAVALRYAQLADPGIAANRIVEKLPLNYLYLGAIRRALPQAKILLLDRSPLDSCFAMYRTLFAAGYPFSYDLAELGRYYLSYQKLVGHWRAVLGSALKEVVYEDLVKQPKVVGAAAAQHCDLKWDDAAVDIQNNKAASLTASASQVRRPIYGSSSGRWRQYRRHLEPLIKVLGTHGSKSSFD